MLQLTFRGCIDAATVDVCLFFLTHPAAIFTPRRFSIIPVFALSSDGSNGDSGIDGFDAWLHNGLHNKVVHSSICRSVFGTQHPGIFFLCVCSYRKIHTHVTNSVIMIFMNMAVCSYTLVTTWMGSVIIW